MGDAPCIVWFRSDLRLDDNPALHAAVAAGSSVIPVFIWAPEEEEPWPPGAASRWWLHQSLKSLQCHLASLGSRLVLRRGPSFKTLQKLIRETGATAIFWNRRYEPAVTARDAAVEKALHEWGLRVETYNANLLFEPWTIQSKSTRRPFQVFTAFWKACLESPAPDPPLNAPKELPTRSAWPASVALDDFGLEPQIDWAGGLESAWHPGEAGADEQLARFIRAGLEDYSSARDLPNRIGTSRLSPHLHFGEISPRRIWAALRRVRRGRAAASVETYLKELGWREFAYHLLFHFPQTSDQPLRREFEELPWRTDSPRLKRWQCGRTGYPLVDAGMRELWKTGWMHNRVRMTVASFLTKDLRINWLEGAYWFWDTLVDADLANNTLGWQWTAGCGADAAPYFRIFNPIRQSERFDPNGDYIRRWVSELAALPARWIHAPWTAPTEILETAKVKLGTTYPRPILDHDLARREALAAFKSIRRKV